MELKIISVLRFRTKFSLHTDVVSFIPQVLSVLPPSPSAGLYPSRTQSLPKQLPESLWVSYSSNSKTYYTHSVVLYQPPIQLSSFLPWLCSNSNSFSDLYLTVQKDCICSLNNVTSFSNHNF